MPHFDARLVPLFRKDELSETEAALIESEYNGDGWKTTREPAMFGGVVYNTVLILLRNQYGDGWEERSRWDIN